MRTVEIVSRVIADCKDYMHVTRWQRLVDISSTAVNGQALALTQLALGSTSMTTVRHRVKAVDRFGNLATVNALAKSRTKLSSRWNGDFSQGEFSCCNFAWRA